MVNCCKVAGLGALAVAGTLAVTALNQEQRSTALHSPINITSKLPLFRKCCFQFNNFDKAPKTIEMQNNGRTVKLQFKYEDDKDIPTFVRPDKREFILYDMEFRWGAKENDGTEHRVDCKCWALENQITFYDRKYRNYKQALYNVDGVMKFAVLYEAKAEAEVIEGIKKVAENVKTMADENKKLHIIAEGGPPLKDFMPKTADPEIKAQYYHYPGSTTMRPFKQIDWVVFADIQPITEAELAPFRSLKNDKGKFIWNNCRAIQPINCRVVQFSKTSLKSLTPEEKAAE